MSEFLDGYDVERGSLLRVADRIEQAWEQFQQSHGAGIDLDPDGAASSLISSELQMVKDDLSTRRFTCGVFGLIKRGKSTLLNSLVGLEVSAMHVTPETAVPVYVDYGETPRAFVSFAEGTTREVRPEEVGEYTSQKSNPNNQLGVTHVTQHVPVRFLRNGVRIIDTPGLDDAQADEIYTERTLQELDAADAGIVVFMSPPTVGATEMSFLEQVASQGLRKSFVVCNMYPQHYNDPDTREQVLAYVATRIKDAAKRNRRQVDEVTIYPVCAYDAWQARVNGDHDAYRASGAETLLTDLEQYLSHTAGRQVLDEAAKRLDHIADLARGEVEVRRRLLDDPHKLAEHRAKVDDRVRELESEFDSAVAGVLANAEPMRSRVRSLLLKPFTRGKPKLRACASPADIEAFVARFRREVEVAGELAARQFHQGFGGLVDQLRYTLEERFHAVMSELNPSAPEITLSTKALLANPEQLKETQRKTAKADTVAVASVAGGSLAGGVVTAAVLGGVLGPLGLIAGALAGYKLSGTLGSARELSKMKAEMERRMDEIAEQVAADFDRHVEQQLADVRKAVASRRESFAADLYAQFDSVEALVGDPAAMEEYRARMDSIDRVFANLGEDARNVGARAAGSGS